MGLCNGYCCVGRAGGLGDPGPVVRWSGAGGWLVREGVGRGRSG